MRKLFGLLFFVLLAFGLRHEAFGPRPLPAPAPLDVAALPAASPPPGMAVFRLPTGTTQRNAALAYRGGAFSDKREFTMTSVLVKHPRGDVLIDTGFGRDIDHQVLALPWLMRRLAAYKHGKSAAEQLDAAGYDRSKLRGVILTHAHWDHVSGLDELPGIPVLVTPEERAYIKTGGFVMAIARNLHDVKYEEYPFDGGPYLGFPKSHDLYGDGSIVIVPAPGHTPGSVIVFLALPGGKRFALIGDLVWQREAIALREERPWPMRKLVDQDPASVRENLLRVAAIAARFPEISMVPAHDARGFEEMPPLEANR